MKGWLKKVEKTGAELSAGNNLKGRKSAARVIDKQEPARPSRLFKRSNGDDNFTSIH